MSTEWLAMRKALQPVSGDICFGNCRYSIIKRLPQILETAIGEGGLRREQGSHSFPRRHCFCPLCNLQSPGTLTFINILWYLILDFNWPTQCLHRNTVFPWSSSFLDRCPLSTGASDLALILVQELLEGISTNAQLRPLTSGPDTEHWNAVVRRDAYTPFLELDHPFY